MAVMSSMMSKPGKKTGMNCAFSGGFWVNRNHVALSTVMTSSTAAMTWVNANTQSIQLIVGFLRT